MFSKINPHQFLNDAIRSFTIDLYAMSHLSRQDITEVINLVSRFITETYNPFLLERLDEGLPVPEEITKDGFEEIRNILQKYSNPFKDFDTEKKRISNYVKDNLYSEPLVCSIGEIQIPKIKGITLSVTEKSVSLVRVSLEQSLKKLFDIPGLFQATLEYMDFLNKVGSEYIENFIQGETWKNQLKNFKALDKNEKVLPLCGYFDDVETGNNLGTHQGTNKVGVVYNWVPCLPPWFSSKLNSIIFSDLFHSNDHKKFGNEAVFKYFIEELQTIYEKGIQITVNNEKYQVYFIFSLMIADNLGNNQIFGYVESFINTRFCRQCYIGPESLKSTVNESQCQLRTVPNYEIDILLLKNKNSLSKSGIKSKCIFNSLNNFHCITNNNFDLTHDLCEGVISVTMCLILLALVDQFGLNINYVNYRMRSMDFQFESGNIPMQINLDYLKSHKKMKMSASETLFFSRYFGIMIGDQISKDNKYWEHYKMLHEIIQIIMAPHHSVAQLSHLDTLITEFLKHHLELFRSISAKFHFLLHYVNAIRRNGPLVKTSTIRFESFHRNLKTSIEPSSCHRQVLLSIAKRMQLKLMKPTTYEKFLVEYGKPTKSQVLAQQYFANAEEKSELHSITINNICYTKNTIIITMIDEEGIEFGKIENVFVADKIINFKYMAFQSLYLDDNYCAYHVLCDGVSKFTNFTSLVAKVPCLMFCIEKKQFIISRYSL